jgi:pimeloyl-ACP methyl ester carboxylesterase
VTETRYTRSADGTLLAYQLSGEGPVDLVFLEWAVPIDLQSEDPGFLRFRRRLGSFSRTLWFDLRGQGASEGDAWDSLAGEICDADLTALIDVVGFRRPALVAEGACAGRAIHFSAAHPEEVSAVVLINGFAHNVREDDYPWGLSPEDLDRRVEMLKRTWGTAPNLELLAPSRASDERFLTWFALARRFHGGPDHVAKLVRANNEADVRSLLPSVSVPTLVLHREGNGYVQLAAGRYLAEHIPNAKFVLLPGDDFLFFVGDTDALADEIEEFLTGARSGAEGEVLTMTVLFTDIVA